LIIKQAFKYLRYHQFFLNSIVMYTSLCCPNAYHFLSSVILSQYTTNIQPTEHI